MSKYKVFLGYKKSDGSFPFLGTVDYSYALNRGCTVLLRKHLLEAAEKIAQNTPDIYDAKNSKYKISAIYHPIDDSEAGIPEVYLVSEWDYINKFKEM